MRGWLAAVSMVVALGCSAPPAGQNDAAVPDAARMQCDDGFTLSEDGEWCLIACPDGPPAMEHGCRSCPSSTLPFLEGCTPGACSSGCHTACPAPTPGSMSICGWIRDLETGALLQSMSRCLRCELDNPEDIGPCGIRIEVFDAFALAENGNAAVPLQTAETRLNDCGRFTMKDIAPPALGWAAVRLTDALGGIRWATTMTPVLAAPNFRRDDLEVYAVPIRLAAGWSVQASAMLGGQSLSSHGAGVEIYRHKGAPVAGVDADAELYFADEVSGGIAILDPARSVTGTTGSALRLSELAAPASGGNLEGCVWPWASPVVIPGLISVQSVDSQDPNGQVCE